MPLYEYYKNAQNHVDLKGNEKNAIIGNVSVFEKIAKLCDDGPVAIDGWYGVNWNLIKAKAKAAVPELECIHAYSIYKNTQQIDEYQKKYETNDPAFGWVNDKGTLIDLIDIEKANKLAAHLIQAKQDNKPILVYGPGAALELINKCYSTIIYADFTMQPLLWKMWGGQLEPFGSDGAAANYQWKKYYYNDFYLLYRHKKEIFTKMDYFIDAVSDDCYKMLPASTYNQMIDELVKGPIKQVKILQPGPWGAYRYKDLWQVDGLECNAWNELAGIELSVLVDIKSTEMFNIPSQNIMQRPVQLVGQYVNETYPDLLPLQVWLDDGYFPEEQPLERVCMPVHDHPSTAYVKEHFNEPLGRYETYYIVEAYKNAATLMGYKENANLEEWEQLCRESENKKEIKNWQDYVQKWETNTGDLFLIPPGTSHGHGGNQMILEMDTGPSVAGTEYSFFTYDFARKTWDDVAKTMTAPPMKMHTKHSFDNQKWIREGRVQAYHRARPIVIDGNGKFRKDRYTTLPEQPFHIERIFFEQKAENDTYGNFMHIVTLTEGKNVTIRSIDHPEYCTSIERLQACIIPACFGRHEYINEDGSHAMVVLIRLKKGEKDD